MNSTEVSIALQFLVLKIISFNIHVLFLMMLIILSRTPSGHQFPATFMMQVAGLDKHMVSSKQPLKYSHLDIAGSSGNLPDPTTGASVAAIVKFFLG